MKHVLGKFILLAFLFIANAAVCHADWFKGKVVNAETGEPLADANIGSETKPQPGWSIQSNVTADSTGCFILGSDWEGRILFTFSMIGYKSSRKVDYSYGDNVKDTIDIGTIKLQPTALMLRDVEVTAKVPRITMSGDTIVFNPEAFKLKEGARLDELIKKLPGVASRDGQLFWRNKPIRLMMNGKNLFGGDNIVGQLPAEVAKKIKLYDRKSELARHTGNDDGEEDNVLDIEVKPGFLDKWYGEASAAYQTEKRYLFDLNASKLSDHDPQLVYAQANNANRFVERTMRSQMNRNVDNDGKSQNFSYNYQHNWQTKGAEELTDNSFDISANLGHSDGWGTNSASTETFFPDQDRTVTLSKNYNYDHKLKPQMWANIFAYADSLNSISIEANASYGKNRGRKETEGASYSYAPDQFEYHSLASAMGAKPGDALYEHLVTRNRNYQSYDGQDRQLSLSYSWKRYLGKKGSFKLGGNTQASGENTDTYNHRSLEYLRESLNETQWQHYDYKNHNLQSTLGATFDYWFSKKFYLNVSDDVTYRRYRTKRNVFADTDEARVNGNSPTTPDHDNHNDANVHSWSNRLSLKSTITPTKQLMIMPKFEWTATREDANYQYGQLDTAAVRNTQTYTPSLFLKWKMSRVRNMDISFAYNTTVPQLTQTFGFRDTTDPMNVSTGNQRLGNTHSHTTTFGYHRMWLRKQIVLGLGMSYTKDINPLSTLYRYNSQTGVYTMTPTNVKGGDTWKFNVDYDQGFGADFRLLNEFSLTTSQAYGFLTLLDNENADAALNHQKQLAISENMELSYEIEKIQLTLYNRLGWNRYRYDATSYNSHPFDNSLGISTNVKLGAFGFSFEVKDHYRSGYITTAMNGHRLLASADATYRFNKNRCCIMLYVDDIFNKDITYDVNYTSYKRSENSYDYIHHYAMLKFTYRFDAKENKK